MSIDVKTFRQRLKDEQVTDVFDQLLAAHTNARVLNVHTAIPGIIDSFDPDTQTAKVKPTIKTLYTPDNDDAQWLERPLCVDVPVCFPGSGDYVLTFPIKQGDECLLVFCERAIDNWFTEGGVQEQSDYREHDASDAVAIVGLRSQPNKLDDFDNENAQLRNSDGDTTITLDKEGTITVAINDTTMTVEDGTVTVKADNIKLDGDVEVTGDLDVSGDVSGDGKADFSNDVTGSDVKTAAGISLQTHVHPETGGTTGPPQ